MQAEARRSSVAEAVVEELIRQFECGQLAQAYLFYGSRSSGHRHAARILTERILAKGPQNPSGFPMEATVKFIANETHPNLFILKPEEDKTEITAERARELNGFLQSTPTLPGWRVALIDPADSLNTAASNALLKKIEELPSRTTVILIAGSLHAIKQTILSRTQKIFFPKVGSEVEELLANSPWAQNFLAEVERMSRTGQTPSQEQVESLKEPFKRAALPGLLLHFVATRAQETLGDIRIARIWLDKYAELAGFITDSKDRALSEGAVIQAMLLLVVQ